MKKKLANYCLLFALSIFFIFYISLSAGASGFDYLSVWWWLTQRESLDNTQLIILETIRMPRIVLALLVGAALGISGTSIQALFKNPLAEPGLIGISAGAALSVAAFIVLNIQFLDINTSFIPFILPIVAFSGGLLSTFIVIKISQASIGSTHAFNLLLAGIAINALASGGISFFIYIANASELRSLTFWTLGGLNAATWQEVVLASIIIIPLTAYLMRQAKTFNTILLGDKQAYYLGLNVKKITLQNIYIIALLVGVATALCGIIAFIGLIVPHILRLLFGPNHYYLLPLSALGGGAILMASDTLARVVIAPAELPVGIITTLVGAPLFLYLITKQNRRHW